MQEQPESEPPLQLPKARLGSVFSECSRHEVVEFTSEGLFGEYEEIAGWLKALGALAEDLGSIPSTHRVSQSSLQSQGI